MFTYFTISSINNKNILFYCILKFVGMSFLAIHLICYKLFHFIYLVVTNDKLIKKNILREEKYRKLHHISLSLVTTGSDEEYDDKQ